MLEVICGPMYSGKSEELMRRLRRAQIAGRSTVLIKPMIDNRYSDEDVVSHNGLKMPAIALDTDDLEGFYDVAGDYQVVGVDEIQFFGEWAQMAVNAIAEYKTIIVSGLDMTFRQEPFGIMPNLLATGDSILKLTAICHKCGSEQGVYTQRLVDGAPAPFDGPTVVVGGMESYEARCRECFEIE